MPTHSSGIAQHHIDAPNTGAKAVQGLLHIVQEFGTQQQVFRGIAADTQLGKDNGACALIVSGPGRERFHHAGIAPNVSDLEVGLPKGNDSRHESESLPFSQRMVKYHNERRYPAIILGLRFISP